MLMADTMAIFLSVLGLLIACPALWLLCRGLWPRPVESLKKRLLGDTIQAILGGTAAANCRSSSGHFSG